MKRTYVAWSFLLVAAAACGRAGKQGAEPAHKVTDLAGSLRPDALSRAMRQMGGAHFHGTARFAVGPAGAPAEVNTTTDVVVDRAGNYRLREENDREGGREVVLHGRELSVALRYGKMIRRVAEEPEPSRLLQEALGAPWAVFELCAPHARVTPAGAEVKGGAGTTIFELGPAVEGGPSASASASSMPGSATLVGLRAWRSTTSVQSVSGRVVVDDATGAPLKADIAARFSARGEGGPVEGTVEVHTSLTEMGATPPIARPEAEDLTMRQRIVPEQRELLRGLHDTRPSIEPPRREPQRREPPRRAPDQARAAGTTSP